MKITSTDVIPRNLDHAQNIKYIRNLWIILNQRIAGAKSAILHAPSNFTPEFIIPLPEVGGNAASSLYAGQSHFKSVETYEEVLDFVENDANWFVNEYEGLSPVLNIQSLRLWNGILNEIYNLSFYYLKDVIDESDGPNWNSSVMYDPSSPVVSKFYSPDTIISKCKNGSLNVNTTDDPMFVELTGEPNVYLIDRIRKAWSPDVSIDYNQTPPQIFFQPNGFFKRGTMLTRYIYADLYLMLKALYNVVIGVNTRGDLLNPSIIPGRELIEHKLTDASGITDEVTGTYNVPVDVCEWDTGVGINVRPGNYFGGSGYESLVYVLIDPYIFNNIKFVTAFASSDAHSNSYTTYLSNKYAEGTSKGNVYFFGIRQDAIESREGFEGLQDSLVYFPYGPLAGEKLSIYFHESVGFDSSENFCINPKVYTELGTIRGDKHLGVNFCTQFAYRGFYCYDYIAYAKYEFDGAPYTEADVNFG